MTADQPTDPYHRKLRRAAIIGGLYGLGSLLGLLWLLWHGAYLHAVGWSVLTSVVWNRLVNPRLPEQPSLSGGSR
jgi:hypothetical protein